MIEVRQWQKKYAELEVLKSLNFQMEEGKTLAVLGESGCGKSTLLKTLAGFDVPDGGSFLFNGQNINALPVHQRGIVYMSQEALLFPHLNVFDNLAYGLNIRKVSKATQREKVMVLAQELGIEDQLEKMPSELSGGQKQRVNFGRALITQPRMLLLDEPFASLDSGTRMKMQKLFIESAEKWKLSTVFVTHDIKEALIMGSLWGTMSNGSLELFESKQAFIAAEQSGAKEEMAFWQTIQSENGRKDDE